MVGGRLKYNSPRVNGKAMVGKGSGEIVYPKKPGARSGGPGALVRQLAIKLPSNLLGPDKYSEILRMIKRHMQLSDKVFAGEIHEPTGVLKVSVSTRDDAGQILCVWSAMRGTCLSLTDFLSEVMFCKLTGWSINRRNGASEHLRQQTATDPTNDALQENIPHRSPVDSTRKISGDRPD